jgi:hypothetical protein
MQAEDEARDPLVEANGPEARNLAAKRRQLRESGLNGSRMIYR